MASTADVPASISTALVAVDSSAAGSCASAASASSARPGAQQYLIRGVSVEFPYPAYECQQVYMEKVSGRARNHVCCNAPTIDE